MIRGVLLVIFFALAGGSFAQSVITWQVKDSEQVPVLGATVLLESGEVLITNTNGKVSKEISGAEIGFQITFVGFKPVQNAFPISGDTTLLIILESDEVVMEAVEIRGNQPRQQLQETGTGYVTFSMEGESGLPYLLGEQDPLKFIQSQSGVASGTDGNNGYYVRGGGIDQNAIELDHIELYNTNHLFGFFSTFNPKAIDQVSFMKSGFPAAIGGRLSSMMRIETINPDVDTFHGHVKVGVLAGGVSLEIPVIKQKSSLLVAARRSYLDLITQNLMDDESEISRRTDYRFSDLILKYNHRINSHHTLSLVGFMGTDDYLFRSERTFENHIYWKTLNGGVNWKWMANADLDGEVYATLGRYEQRYGAGLSIYQIDLDSYIANARAGTNVFLTRGSHLLTFGAEYSYRSFRPSQVHIESTQEEFNLSEVSWLPTAELAVSVDDEITLTEQLRIGLGLRLSSFVHLGPFTRYETTENLVSVDSTHFSHGEWVQHYVSPEPRVRVNYLMNQNSALKASYDRNVQYIHLSPLGSVSLPTDIWVPSSQKIRPQKAHQVALGYYSLLSSQIKYSVEGYYKLLQNQIEYRNGAIAGYSGSKNFDDDFIFGKGQSYGVEFSVTKDAGSVEYQASYTLSKTERSFEEVQGGETFRAKYDRTHDLNLIGTYHLGNWSFSGLFKLSSGNNLTVPVAKYVINESIVSEYSDRNAFRLPMYHRLDVAASWHPSGNEQVTWVFSVYNVYNRRNPYFVYFDVKGDVSAYALDISLKEVALFPVLPSLSFEFSF
jgi:hypothetical protein